MDDDDSVEISPVNGTQKKKKKRHINFPSYLYCYIVLIQSAPHNMLKYGNNILFNSIFHHTIEGFRERL